MASEIDIINTFLGFLFWFTLIFAIISPYLSLRSVKVARLRLMSLIERKYGYRVITMIHRQEKVGLFGIPIHRYIDIEDSEAVIRAIRTTPKDRPIMFVIHTPGGLVLAASQIARALKDHPAETVVVVPHYAMSGGTLIALAADEIIMDPHAILGPLDPQLVGPNGIYMPAPSVVKAVKLKGADKVSDTTLILADVAEKALNQMKALVREFLEGKVPEDRIDEIVEELVSGKYTHDYPITVDILKKWGIPVKTEVPPEIYELMELYPQARSSRPNIEYLPYPLPAPKGRQ